MARPLRIEYAGALYHITSRGNKRENIYLSNSDRTVFLALLGATCERYAWHCYAYCLMDNHYHLLIETSLGNLSKGMQYLNGVYTQRFNKEHQRVGHVFQGRYKSILVEKESYLLELSRYIVLNPVRANMVQHVSDWTWSSYLSMIDDGCSPKWLKTNAVLSLFGSNKEDCQNAYIHFIQQKITTTPWKDLKNQIYLGSQDFVNKAIAHVGQDFPIIEIPKIQYTLEKSVLTLNAYAQQFVTRDQAIYEAYASGNYTMKQIGDFFGLHYSRVSKIVNRYQGKRKDLTPKLP